ncbi:MAG: NPCBM/NEW2 domain-containing protein [Planctomycetaceae bacterium]
MPALAPALLAAVLLAAPQVKLVTLDGEERQGELRGISAIAVTLAGVEGAAEGTLETPLANVLEVEFPPADPAAQPGPAPVLVELTDGSRIACADIELAARDATLDTRSAGKLRVPVASVAAIRFVDAAGPHQETWNELRERDTTRDLLVVKKEDVLDHLAGVVESVDAKSVQFLFEGNKIPVARDRVFGLIYAGREAAKGEPVCEVRLAGDDRIKVRALALKDDAIELDLLAGGKATVPVAAVRTLDFSLGKVRFLSQMEPREVKYTPFFDVTWEYRRDSNLDGEPIRIGDQTFRRGLCIHSKTLLRYRLGGEYRRLQALMGIDRAVGRDGDVRVTIGGVTTTGQARKLFEGDVKGTDDAIPLDLDVSGLRDLEIIVDFGGNLDIADHLSLGDARVIK